MSDFKLIQRDGHDKKTIARGDSLEDIAEFAAEKSGMDVGFAEPEDFVGLFDDE